MTSLPTAHPPSGSIPLQPHTPRLSSTDSYVLRYMTVNDIPQVMMIDRLSFPSPWNLQSYTFEIAQSNTSHMVILTTAQPRSTGWRGWWTRLRGQPTETVTVGYAGMWYIAGEAHISTIAVHPDRRGYGLGEVILNGLMQRAVGLGAEYSILEVRISNEPAQALYRKYGYAVLDSRPNYYRDNNEDAYIMHTLIDADYADRLRLLTQQLATRVNWHNQLTSADQPTHTGNRNTPFSQMTTPKG